MLEAHPLFLYSLAIVAGVLAGIVNTVAGSGSLITLPMLVALGLPVAVANGTNRVGVAIQNVVGIATLRHHGALDLRGSHRFIVFVVAGAIVGAFVAVDIDETILSYTIGAIMVAMLIVVAANPKRWLEREDGPETARWWAYPAFVAIGFYGGFVQAGVGILLLVGLVMGAGFDSVRANGVKLFLNLLFTATALVVFAAHDQVVWSLGFLMAFGQAIGAYFAARFLAESERAAHWIRRVLIAVIVVSAGKFFGLY